MVTMRVLVVLTLVVAVIGKQSPRDVSDEVYYRFPRLFHLDDYEKCLLRPQGLYCVGDFQLSQHPDAESSIFPDLQFYSSEPLFFNRTRIHRGYCVSDRCPSQEQNTSLRFEKCVNQWSYKKGLKADLYDLQYCQTYEEVNMPKPLDTWETTYLVVIGIILVMNIVGTIYDIAVGDKHKKNKLLMAWSIPENWRKLTNPSDGSNPRLSVLAPINGLRVFLWILLIVTHSGIMHMVIYLYNPRYTDKMSLEPVVSMFQNGTSIVHVFIGLSTFFFSYNLLVTNKNKPLSVKSLPKNFIKRIFRMSPLHLLVTGFMATVWMRLNEGPLWPAVAGAEHKICKRKFWTHALYLNNIIDGGNSCVLPSWFLASDMQLYLIGAILTLTLAKYRKNAIPVLGVLYILAIIFNLILAFVYKFKSMIFLAYPEGIRKMYADDESFKYFYIMPTSGLPCAIIGLFTAHFIYEKQEEGFDINKHKWMKFLYHISVPLFIGWVACGAFVRYITSPTYMAIHIVLERLAISGLLFFNLVGICFNVSTPFVKFISWSGFRVLARLSLPVMLIHWAFNAYLVLSRPYAIVSSTYDVTMDGFAVMFLSYLAAIPISVMIELPCQKFLTDLFF